jgi:hypothetical protein
VVDETHDEANDSPESKRRYPRLEFGIRVFEEKDWMIRDLNPLGCFIETSTPLHEGSELDVNFQIPSEGEYVPISAKGIVRRCTAEGMAIEFIDLDPTSYTTIEDFVDTYY